MSTKSEISSETNSKFENETRPSQGRSLETEEEVYTIINGDEESEKEPDEVEETTVSLSTPFIDATTVEQTNMRQLQARNTRDISKASDMSFGEDKSVKSRSFQQKNAVVPGVVSVDANNQVMLRRKFEANEDSSRSGLSGGTPKISSSISPARASINAASSSIANENATSTLSTSDAAAKARAVRHILAFGGPATRPGVESIPHQPELTHHLMQTHQNVGPTATTHVSAATNSFGNSTQSNVARSSSRDDLISSETGISSINMLTNDKKHGLHASTEHRSNTSVSITDGHSRRDALSETSRRNLGETTDNVMQYDDVANVRNYQGADGPNSISREPLLNNGNNPAEAQINSYTRLPPVQFYPQNNSCEDESVHEVVLSTLHEEAFVAEIVDDYVEVVAKVDLDKEEKNDERLKKRFITKVVKMTIIILLIVIISAISVGVKLFVKKGPKSTPAVTQFPSSIPSMQPTTIDFTLIVDYLSSNAMVEKASFYNNDESPLEIEFSISQYEAIKWLSRDTGGFNVSHPNFMQRYTLAVFYFALNGDKWDKCKQTDYVCKDRREPFLSSSSECEWFGIKCDRSKQIEKIHIDNNNLVGVLPTEIGMLASLKYLFLDNNLIYGTLPSTMHLLTQLKSMRLGRNLLDSPLHDSFFQMPSLETAYLHANRFTGTIPSLFSNLTNLKQLNLAGNYFSGSIPKAFNRLERLELLILSFNQLNGTLHQGIFRIPSLKEFFSNDNFISGTIPDSLGLARDLQKLYLQNNKFTGKIPKSLGNLTKIETLNFSLNELTGVISEEIFDVLTLEQFDASHNDLSGRIPWGTPKIKEFRISHNKIFGEIPVNIYYSKTLNYIDISNNEMMGEISSLIGNLTNLQYLYLADNDFNGNIPAELGNCSLVELSMHGNNFAGIVPQPVCELKSKAQSNLKLLTADCNGTNAKVVCNCCSACY